ncbi:hypothetical protein RS130_09150 [Paraglaciecola aquimarina]|uniref:Acetylglutamate kinase n=1 Tax=Paraglaciecola aquimarina TaxID=1235557 RepID=A0ABU3SVP6_9ALTE|nr:hypothetical protein [Paraglaciecola aquimarina]MDU0354081.1 hypothetical protein [Paraglaciecola aquimarina]
MDANKVLINELTSEQITQLVEQNVIRDGMIVKVEAALTAANSLGRNVTIASWKDSDKLLGLLQQQAVGTKIFPSQTS